MLFHIDHIEYGFSLVWILLCLVKLPFREKVLSHWSHENGFYPVWILVCIVKLCLDKNCLLQIWQLYMLVILLRLSDQIKPWNYFIVLFSYKSFVTPNVSLKELIAKSTEHNKIIWISIYFLDIERFFRKWKRRQFGEYYYK